MEEDFNGLEHEVEDLLELAKEDKQLLHLSLEFYMFQKTLEQFPALQLMLKQLIGLLTNYILVVDKILYKCRISL